MKTNLIEIQIHGQQNGAQFGKKIINLAEIVKYDLSQVMRPILMISPKTDLILDTGHF